MTKLKTSSAAARTKASASAHTPAPAPGKSKGLILETPPSAPGQTHDQLMARVAVDGIVGNARSLVIFGDATFGELSLSDCAMAMKATAKSMNDGDLSAAVTMLASQAVALNAMFGELARVGIANLGNSPDYADRCLRLAFKAQGQTRATLETLAAIKNPPVVYARQMNVANGPQQVNNGTALSSTPASAHARETVSQPNELLEDRRHGRTQLDARATATAGRAHQDVEAVGAVNRAAQP
jgi:hypothetical protein